jgi:hypothetical protein
MRYVYILLIFLTACGSGTNTTDAAPKLISCSHQFVMSREIHDFSYYDDHENFISKYFSVRYEENRIVATTLMNINCMDSIAGRIEASNDTIYLKNKIEILMSDERLCPQLHKFTFIISNPNNMKYKIVSNK